MQPLKSEIKPLAATTGLNQDNSQMKTLQTVVSHFIFVFCILLSACGTRPIETLEKSSVAVVHIATTPEENVNDFSSILQCVGMQVAAHGSKRFFIGATDKIYNETGVREGLPESGRTMLQSAFSTLVEYSDDKVVWSGWWIGVANNINANNIKDNKELSKIGYGAAFVDDTPEFNIFGAITQYEKDIQRSSRDQTLKLGDSKYGVSDLATLSLIAANLTLHNNRSDNMSVYKGIQSNNLISVKNMDYDSGLLLGAAKIGGFNFNVSMLRKEGNSSALLNLMQLGAIEITGKFYKDDFDYRECLDSSTRQVILARTSWKKPFVGNNTLEWHKKPAIRLTTIKGPENGTPLLIRASASNKSYLYCFHSMADGSMARIFPNAYTQTNEIGITKSVIVPDEKLRVRVVPEAGKNESVTCIASTVDAARLVASASSLTPSTQFSVARVLEKFDEYLIPEAYVSAKIAW